MTRKRRPDHEDLLAEQLDDQLKEAGVPLHSREVLPVEQLSEEDLDRLKRSQVPKDAPVFDDEEDEEFARRLSPTARLHGAMNDKVERHFYQTTPFSSSHVRSSDISLTETEVVSHYDGVQMRHVDRLTTWLASNSMSQTVEFSKTVNAEFSAPETWRDHFLLTYPTLAQWWAKLTGRMVNRRVHKKAVTAKETRTVSLHDLVPKLQIPKGARNGFPVVYVTSQDN